MTEKATYRRLVRREQYRSRSTAVVVALALVCLGAAYVGTESALAATGMPPLLVTPQAAVEALNSPATAVVVAGALAAAFGLVLLVLAVAPGRRARHSLPHERLAIVVDDQVLAGAFSRAARGAAAVPADRVRTTVSPRRAAVAVVPSSGFPVDAATVAETTRDLADRLAAVPPVRVTVSVASSGVVGS